MGVQRRPFFHSNVLVSLARGDGAPVEIQNVRTIDAVSLAQLLKCVVERLTEDLNLVAKDHMPSDALTPSRARVFLSLEISQRV